MRLAVIENKEAPQNTCDKNPQHHRAYFTQNHALSLGILNLENLPPALLEKMSTIVERQKPDSRFVIIAAMLGLDTVAFDRLATRWLEHGGPGFVVDGVPFRKVIDGQFYIQRLTVRRLAA